jgi:putative ABC transport system permease protein
MIIHWLIGLLRTRSGRLLGTIAGIALTIALLADLGLFLDQSSRSMTARALQAVSTDWQVELVPGASLDGVAATLRAGVPITYADSIGYADIASFVARTGDTVQATGAGKAVGVPQDYFERHARDIRLLAGTISGAVLLQQTAANLHVQPGDEITVERPGLADATLRISGVIDLKSADSFFQAIGVPAGAAPQAPPDNAVLMPLADWSTLFPPAPQAQPAGIRTQLHVGLDHSLLPPDPNDAYNFIAAAGRNFEERAAGTALLSNNLAAQLDATRGDALYARVLFLFLGAPRAILAALLTLAVAASGRATRRRDQALLKLRGAAPGTALRYLVAEAIAVSLFGALAGVVLALAAGMAIAGLTLDNASLPWLLGAGLAGLVLAAIAILAPALWSMRVETFARTRLSDLRGGPPLWQRLYLDLLCLALAGIVFWQTAATGYQVVLATEGVTATAVDYTAFLAPVLLWIGAGLVALRLSRAILRHGRPLLERLVAPFAPAMAPAVAAGLSRQHARLGMGVALAALAVAFLVSTALFNATYEAQGLVDAQLTNGADVTVSGSTGAPAGALLARLREIPGVVDAEPMQHRYAYVGTDLQDLYGIDPTNIGRATPMANAFFVGGNAVTVLARLATRPDAVLVSEETVNDFQLSPGDTLNLRLQGADHQFHTVPFVFSGVVREFPTAPRDSFLVANADYVAKATGIAAREVVLMKANGDLAPVKRAAETLASGMGAKVTSLPDAVEAIGSSLTAVDLRGLSRLELSFALLLAAGAAALVLGLALADRRRDFAIMTALGAPRRALGAFVWAEGVFVVALGVSFGAITGALVAQILTKVLAGVFDPPPEQMNVPWGYMALAAVIIVVATTAAVANGIRQAAIDPIGRLREQ